jgi:hypothetical protein
MNANESSVWQRNRGPRELSRKPYERSINPSQECSRTDEYSIRTRIVIYEKAF